MSNAASCFDSKIVPSYRLQDIQFDLNYAFAPWPSLIQEAALLGQRTEN